MIPACNYLLPALLITFVPRIGVACDLAGSYTLHWEETHGDQPRSDFRFDFVLEGEAPRALLDGVQAEAANNCRMNTEGWRSRYLLAFNQKMYSALGWKTQHDFSKLVCFWNDLFFIRHNPSKIDVSFDCPAQFSDETPSHEAELLCSVRKTAQETFTKKRVTFNNTKAYFGVVGSSGIFSLERIDK